MTQPLRIAIAGAGGRMGQMLIQAVCASTDLKLSAAIDMAGSRLLGQDAGQLLGLSTAVMVSDRTEEALQGADCLIDFTRPEGTLAHLAICERLKVKMVIGTTGFSDAETQRIRAASQGIAIMMAPNMSVGVNVTLKLLALAAKSLDADYDVEIIEAHHRHKVDAPSGTALKMGEVVAQASQRDLSTHGGARAPRSIGFATVRGGDIVGDHTVLFAGEGERIEITHKSSSRSTYAQGSLRAARFLADKTQGLFDMFDVLGLQ
jgi:4-hydroxy-tetrahydrodipicolinate reductase